MLKKLKKNLKNLVANRVLAPANALRNDERGEGYLDLAMKILITVVIGGAILVILNTAMPELFQNLVDLISDQLTNVTVLP